MMYVDTFKSANVEMHALCSSVKQEYYHKYNLFFSWLHTMLVKLGLQGASGDNTSGDKNTKEGKDDKKNKEKKKPPKKQKGDVTIQTQDNFVPQQLEA